MLYQLSYPGTGSARPVGLLASGGYRQGISSCPVALSPFFGASCFVELILVSGAVGRLIDGHTIALVEPAIEVPVAAASTAKRLIFLHSRLAAKRAPAGFGGELTGHGRLLSRWDQLQSRPVGRYSARVRRSS